MSAHGAKGHRIDHIILDPLNYSSFQPVLHDWYNKGRGMCYPLSGMVLMNDPLLLMRIPAPDRGTCARDRRQLQQLALNVHVKHSDLT